MQISNKFSLPGVFVAMANRDNYSRGMAERSVTQLIDSPRVVNMRIKHEPQMIEDVSDIFWRLMGTAFHEMLEHAAAELPEYVTEQRFFAEIEGWTVSGAIDVQERQIDQSGFIDGVELQDYKLTSVWSVMNPKVDWERQLNLYKWLYLNHDGAYRDDPPVTGLKVIALLRDWSRREAERRADYPQSPIWPVEIPMWSEEDALQYLTTRITLHKDAAADAAFSEDDLIACSDEERWVKATKFAVVKEGNKRAKKVCDSHEEASAYMTDNGLLDKEGWRIEVRLGEPTRCVDNFCGVAEHCNQFRKWKEDNNG